MSRLNCGCASANATVWCMYCHNSRCYDHRDRPHFCPECPACGFRHGYPLHEWDGRKLHEIGVRRAS